MAVSGEDVLFTEVSRKGEAVRWRGLCTFGIDEEQASVTVPETRAAQLSDRQGRLEQAQRFR
jgi:hypothetical protein